MKFMGRTERWLLIIGLLLIGFYLAAFAHRAILSRVGLQRFRDSQAQQSVEGAVVFPPATQFKLDVSLWSEKRISGYEQSLKEYVDPPLAVLRIPKVHLEVPVLDGTDEMALNRGVGHIVGTDRPGGDGNVGIAGHRDGFFRGLKDISPGDTIELLSPTRVVTYVVDDIVLVRPDDVSVLQPRSRPSLTLVTCYPFYFIGSAPQRYIVQASVKGSSVPDLHTSKWTSSEPERLLQESRR